MEINAKKGERESENDLPKIVALAEDEVSLGEEGRADLAEATIAARTFEAILVPHLVEGLEQVTLAYDLVAAEAFGWLAVRMQFVGTRV